MFTFLLDEYKNRALREYRLRLTAIYLSLFAVILFIGAVLAIPQYAIIGAQREAAILTRTAAESASEDESGSISTEVRAIKAQLAIIRENSALEPITSILERVLENRESGISITSISLFRGKSQKAIEISGIASTRDALVSFSSRLEEEPTFSKATLPVSSLAKNRDIAFSISIDSKF